MTAAMISGSQIQLLDVLPSDGDDEAPIRCTVKRVLLEDEPAYEALSYVWGDPRSLEIVQIDVDGGNVPVTRNLDAVLRRLRRPDVPRTLWVDQLCINQSDALEKAHQVGLMREIYSSCRACILWMGELPDDISLEDAGAVLGLIEYMADAHDAHESGGVPEWAYLKENPDFEGPSKAMAALIGEDESRNEISWWMRIWTVQEAALPPRMDLLWGPLALPWERMMAASHGWTQTGAPGDVHELMARPTAPCLGTLMAKVIWLEIAKDRSDSPLYLIYRWRYRRATDPRDKAYALMGLCERGKLPVVERCSYEAPVVDVYCAMTVDLILDERSLLPLIGDPTLPPDLATPGIPSWAWDVRVMSHFNTDLWHLYAFDWYIANCDREIDTEAFRERMREEPHVLRIPGARADVIAHVARPMVLDRRTPIEKAPYHEILNEWRDFGLARTSSRARFWEEFGKTLLGDLIHGGGQEVERRATTSDVHAVYAYLVGDEYGEDVQWSVRMMTANRAFFITEGGLLGLGSPDMRVGDEVWVLHGGKVPFTLRPRAEGKGKKEDKPIETEVMVDNRGAEGEEDDSHAEKEKEEDTNAEAADKSDEKEGGTPKEVESEGSDEESGSEGSGTGSGTNSDSDSDSEDEEPKHYEFGGNYDLGGSCYVHGLMNGELFYWDDAPPEEVMVWIH